MLNLLTDLSCMKLMQCCQTTHCFNLNFFFLFSWVKKVLLARIKPPPDTAVIFSVTNGFYLLTDDTCQIFLLPGAFNKNIFPFFKSWFVWYYCCPELAPFCSGYLCS